MLTVVDATDTKFFIYDVACPLSSRETLIIQILTDTTGNISEKDLEFWIKDSQLVNSEDQSLVESQSPEEVPLDIREEVHIHADRLSLEYRKALVKFGLGAPEFTT